MTTTNTIKKALVEKLIQDKVITLNDALILLEDDTKGRLPVSDFPFVDPTNIPLLPQYPYWPWGAPYYGQMPVTTGTYITVTANTHVIAGVGIVTYIVDYDTMLNSPFCAGITYTNHN